MVLSILYILLALLGISFLVFIHELGHYFTAKRAGIKIEVFSIGFGKSILEWMHGGVKWKIGILPFGGYVKMAGMEKQGAIEPYQIEGGFFAQKPWTQIKVAAMGPIVNIFFAFFAFTLLWTMGGRDKPFSEFTKFIGWVDREGKLYDEGIRPGDEITRFNSAPYKSFENLLYRSVVEKGPSSISGNEIDYTTGERTPFTYTFSLDEKADGMDKAYVIATELAPAQYLIYDTLPKGGANPLPEDSPMAGSGISYGDRILWVDGQLIFSRKQLTEVLNGPSVLLTVLREGKTFTTRVPRMKIADLRLAKGEREELDDWRNEIRVIERVDTLNFIPYNLTVKAEVEEPLGYIDENSRSKPLFDVPERAYGEIPLEKGDKIIAVQGKPIQNSYELLRELQNRRSLIIVKNIGQKTVTPSTQADAGFVKDFDLSALNAIVQSIGTPNQIHTSGALTLLNPVLPVPSGQLPMSPEQRKQRKEIYEKQKKAIDEMRDPVEKEEALKEFQEAQNQLMIGLPLQDRKVAYNPNPFVLFEDVFRQIYKTLFALFGGTVSPKHLMGPVGVVQVIQYSWSLGAKEALYWLGLISLNLGLLNLLPIPVLDGGHIVLALWEGVTKKPLKAKTRERLILPFVILIVGFFIYMTYNDILRIFTTLF
jgi:regulator of sigma E protease